MLCYRRGRVGYLKKASIVFTAWLVSLISRNQAAGQRCLWSSCEARLKLLCNRNPLCSPSLFSSDSLSWLAPRTMASFAIGWFGFLNPIMLNVRVTACILSVKSIPSTLELPTALGVENWSLEEDGAFSWGVCNLEWPVVSCFYSRLSALLLQTRESCTAAFGVCLDHDRCRTDAVLLLKCVFQAHAARPSGRNGSVSPSQVFHLIEPLVQGSQAIDVQNIIFSFKFHPLVIYLYTVIKYAQGVSTKASVLCRGVLLHFSTECSNSLVKWGKRTVMIEWPSSSGFQFSYLFQMMKWFACIRKWQMRSAFPYRSMQTMLNQCWCCRNLWVISRHATEYTYFVEATLLFKVGLLCNALNCSVAVGISELLYCMLFLCLNVSVLI